MFQFLLPIAFCRKIIGVVEALQPSDVLYLISKGLGERQAIDLCVTDKKPEKPRRTTSRGRQRESVRKEYSGFMKHAQGKHCRANRFFAKFVNLTKLNIPKSRAP
jgi:hypothetical protein